MRAWFRALLRLFPADFRGDYGAQMQETFGEEIADSGGGRGRAAIAGRNLTAALRLGPRLHLEQLGQDVRYALRAMRRAPMFTLVAAGALAFGIGSTVSTFAMADAFLLRPLPFERPAELVHLWAADRARGYDQLRASLPEFEAWRARTDLFSDAAIFNYTAVEVTSGPEPESIAAGRVTANVFDLLGVSALRGRPLQAGDDVPGAAPVVVLSEILWRTRYGAAEDVIGRSVAIAGTPHTIVGVMPSDFVFPLPTTRLWVARTVDRARLTADVQAFQVVARLQPGISAAAAEAALATASPAIAAAHPALAGRSVHLQPLREALNFAHEIFAVGALVIGLANLMVLFTACANISSLMLGRAVSRGREVAIRAAIGASRFRLVRQFLVESLLLAALGAGLGLGLASWGLGLADGLIPGDLYRAEALGLDVRAAAVAVALAIASALLFGLAPALRFARANLGDAMRQDGGGSTTSRRSLRLQSFFVEKQVALSVVLLVATVLIARSFSAMGSVDPGFDPDGVLTLQMSLPAARYPDADARARFHIDVVERVSALPGVEAAATVDYLPLNHEYNAASVSVPQADTGGPPPPDALLLVVSPQYFDVMRLPVLEGRAFAPTDLAGRDRVVIVSAALARRHWPGRSPVGATLRLNRESEPYVVVGVVADTRHVDLSAAIRDQVYLPQGQRPTGYLRVIARTRSDASAGLASAAAAVHQVDALLPVNEPRTLRQVVDDFLLPQRSLSVVLLALGGFSLWLALFGIYGIVSCYVSDRTREIGVRSALGATEGQVIRYVMGRGLRLAVRGGLVGLVLALVAGWALRGLLFGVAAGDPVTYAVVAVLVVGVAVAAGLVPARRAARVNPVTALRA